MNLDEKSRRETVRERKKTEDQLEGKRERERDEDGMEVNSEPELK